MSRCRAQYSRMLTRFPITSPRWVTAILRCIPASVTKIMRVMQLFRLEGRDIPISNCSDLGGSLEEPSHLPVAPAQEDPCTTVVPAQAGTQGVGFPDGNLRNSYRSPGRGGAVAARPVHPEYPGASAGCIEGPAQLSVGAGPTPVLATELRGPLESEQLQGHPSGCAETVHPCYSLSVKTAPPLPQLSTIHYPPSTMEHRCPILSRFVPRCPTPDTNRGTPGVPFFGKVSHRPDRNGTLWDAMGQLTGKSTHSAPPQGAPAPLRGMRPPQPATRRREGRGSTTCARAR